MSIATRMAGLATGGKRPGIAEKRTAPEAAPPPLAGAGGPDEKVDGGVPDALTALHGKMGGKHVHVHQNDMGELTSHHAAGDGTVTGPHDHDNIEALKAAMDQFLTEEENESEEPAGGEGGESLFA